MRSRLVLLIAIPTATAVALGGVSIVGSWRSAVANQRTETLASLSTNVTQLAFEIEAERDSIVTYIAAGQGGRAGVSGTHQTQGSKDQLQIVNQRFDFTAPWVKTVNQGIAQIGSGYPTAVQAAASAVLASLKTLPNLRNLALHSQVAAGDIITDYGNLVETLLTFDDQVALSSGDAELSSTARALDAISRAENEDSVQRAIVMYALTNGSFTSGLLSQLNSSLADLNADLADFSHFATTTQQSAYGNALAQSLQDRVQGDEGAIIQHSDDVALAAIVPNDWYGAMTDEITNVHGFEESLVRAAVDRSKQLRQQAIISAIAVGTLILLVLVLSLLFTVFVGRSMVRPLRRLRAGALEVAGIKLPETVRRMNETDGENVPVEVEPIDVESSDEIGEVARAFDQVHREALRLAATEAALRGNVNAMFVNLSRRSQSLVERQIRLIDELEQGEQDSERLSSLFQMDHLATRMRRNSENLLVLAGHESSRRWNQPVPLVNVLAGRDLGNRAVRARHPERPARHRGPRPGRERRRAPDRRAGRERDFVLLGRHSGWRVRAPARQRRRAARHHRRGRRHGRRGDGARELAAGQPAGRGRRGLPANGPVRGRATGGQARHPGAVAPGQRERPDGAGLAAR